MALQLLQTSMQQPQAIHARPLGNTIDQELRSREMSAQPALSSKLNLGCGRDIRSGWINLDKANLPGVNVVHDLEKLPLPFADGQFDHINAKDVLEHVDYIRVLADLHRILRVGGTLDIQVPHFTSADNFIDPTHIKRFSIRTFEFFVADSTANRDYYFDFSFRSITRRRVTFRGGALFYDALVARFVNSHYKIQQYYELTFLSRLFPAQNIVVTLVK